MATPSEVKRLLAAKTVYEILGVHYQSTTKQVKAARADLAWRFHSDHWSDPRADGCMGEINTAVDTILDSKRHQRYRTVTFAVMRDCAACKGTGYTWRQIKVGRREEFVCIKCTGSGRVK